MVVTGCHEGQARIAYTFTGLNSILTFPLEAAERDFSRWVAHASVPNAQNPQSNR
jgi:hypothetical protein